MATPRKPGAARGRPKGSRRDLRYDPDRYQIAAGLALQTLGFSQRKAFDLAATATPFCDTIEQPVLIRPGKVQKRIAFELTMRPGDNLEPTIKGRASVLRQKAMRHYAQDEALWLRKMAAAICLSMIGREDTEPQIMALAYSVGELQFARDRLLIPGAPGLTYEGKRAII
jgi:hypothetical protein